MPWIRPNLDMKKYSSVEYSDFAGKAVGSYFLPHELGNISSKTEQTAHVM